RQSRGTDRDAGGRERQRYTHDSSVMCRYIFFFFSSRRRHTILVSDWSSDVCSSDLPSLTTSTVPLFKKSRPPVFEPAASTTSPRSEERRVGKECRSRVCPCR